MKKTKLKCPNCGRRIADYNGESEAHALLTERNGQVNDFLCLKCHLCKSQVLIALHSVSVDPRKCLVD